MTLLMGCENQLHPNAIETQVTNTMKNVKEYFMNEQMVESAITPMTTFGEVGDLLHVSCLIGFIGGNVILFPLSKTRKGQSNVENSSPKVFH